MPRGVIVLAPGGTVLAYGPAPRTAEADPAIAVGTDYFDLIANESDSGAAAPKDLAEGIAAVAEGLRDTFSLEYPLPGQPASRWIGITAAPFAEPPPRRVLLLHYDAGERKRTEALVRHTDQRARRLLDRSRELLVATDANGRVKFVNGAVERTLGYDAAHYARLAIWDLVHPDDLDTARNVLAAVLERPTQPATAEVRVRHVHGHWVWIDMVAWNLLEDPDVGALVTCARDVSDIRRARDALRDAERRIATVLDSPRTFLATISPEGTVLTVNRVARHLAGAEGTDLAGRPIWEAACWEPGTDAAVRWRKLVEQARRGEVAESEMSATPPAGAPIMLDVSVRPVFDDAGRVPLLVCEGYDVTPGRRTDVVLRAMLDGLGTAAGPDFFAALVEHLCRSLAVDAALIAELCAPDRIRTLAVCSATGPAANFEAHIAGTPFEHPADRRITAYATGVLKAFPRDKLLRDLQADAYVGIPLFSADGGPIGLLAVLHRRSLDPLDTVTDIVRLFGDRAAAELERLRARQDIARIQEAIEQRVEARAADALRRALALDDVDCGVALFDGEIVYVANEAFARLYGYGSTAAIAGRRWDDLHAGGHPHQEDVDPIVAARRLGRWQGDLMARRLDGARFTADVVLRRTPEGNLVCTCRDVSAQRQNEASSHQRVKQLTTTNTDLLAAARARDLYVDSVNHELRPPLHVILGLAEALGDAVHGLLNEAQARSVHSIESSARHLLDVVNDFRDIASIGGPDVDLDRVVLDVRTLVEESIGPLRAAIRDRRLAMETSFDGIATSVWADPRRARRVLTALLVDAAARTPTGGRFGIDVAASHPPGSVAFTVWTGPDTVPPAKGARGGGRATPTAAPGASLGPATALLFRLIELHGGTVALDSNSGQGTRISLVLPPQRTSPCPDGTGFVPDPDAEVRGVPGGGTILLAEDNETTARFMEDYLQAIGYRVMVARDGRDAVDHCIANPPGLVLIDTQMPGLDGLEAIRLIRNEPALTGVPIVALTALATPADRERCLAAGANAYVAKPLRLKELRAMVAAYLGPPLTSEQPHRKPGARP